MSELFEAPRNDVPPELKDILHKKADELGLEFDVAWRLLEYTRSHVDDFDHALSEPFQQILNDVLGEDDRAD